MSERGWAALGVKKRKGERVYGGVSPVVYIFIIFNYISLEALTKSGYSNFVVYFMQ